MPLVLAAHEGYPGHHAYNTLREQVLFPLAGLDGEATEFYFRVEGDARLLCFAGTPSLDGGTWLYIQLALSTGAGRLGTRCPARNRSTAF